MPSVFVQCVTNLMGKPLTGEHVHDFVSGRIILLHTHVCVCVPNAKQINAPSIVSSTRVCRPFAIATTGEMCLFFHLIALTRFF